MKAEFYIFKGKTYTDVELEECPRHAHFPVFGKGPNGYGQVLYTKCPKCEKAEQALKGACLPKRFADKRVRDYVVTCDGQRKAKEVVMDYCKTIDKKILDGVRAVTMRPLVDVLGEIDQDLVKGALAGEHFQEYFFANATDEAIIAKVKEILGL